MAFMANAYVFPGGKLDDLDHASALHEYCEGRTAEETQRVLDDVEAGEAVALYVAALRETFEEAGVLLARDAQGQFLDFGQADVRARFADHREALNDGKTSLLEMVEKENLRLALDQIFYWDHWVTPEIEPKRYAARFFVAMLPPSQEPFHDQKETTDSVWFTPSEAIALYDEGGMQLAPPTYKVILDLQKTPRMEDVFALARERRAISPVLPVAKFEEGQLVLMLPEDRDYPGAPADSTRLHRARLLDGRWQLEDSA